MAGHKATTLLAEFLKCQTSLKRLVAKVVKRHDIDDILQETFIRTYAAADKTEIDHPRAFMHRTAYNLALNHVTSAYQKRVQLEDSEVLDVYLVANSAEADFEAHQKFLEFCRAVRDLPPQCRKVFVLRKVYGFSQHEIAEYLQISESTVEKHVVKGLLTCRELTATTPNAADAARKKGMSRG